MYELDHLVGFCVSCFDVHSKSVRLVAVFEVVLGGRSTGKVGRDVGLVVVFRGGFVGSAAAVVVGFVLCWGLKPFHVMWGSSSYMICFN